MNAINQQQKKKENEFRKTEIQNMEAMKKELLTINLKLDNPTSTLPLEKYADKVKANRNETQTKRTADIRSGTIQNRYPRNILLIKSNQKFRESIEIKKAFASVYPNKNYCTPLLQRVVVVYILSL